MRNKLKLIIEKEKTYTDWLKHEHNSLTYNIQQLTNEKCDIENKLINNLICPKCYFPLTQNKFTTYGETYYECTSCDFSIQQ